MTPILLTEIERRGLQSEYTASIMAIVLEKGIYSDLSQADIFLLLRATPEQHARAFLEAIQWPLTIDGTRKHTPSPAV